MINSGLKLRFRVRVRTRSIISWLRRWALWGFVRSKRVRVASRVITMRTMTRVRIVSETRARRRVVGFIL